MGFYHINRDIHHGKVGAISHGKKPKNSASWTLRCLAILETLKARKERETREHKAREIRNKAFRELKKGVPVIVGTLGVKPEKKTPTILRMGFEAKGDRARLGPREN